MGFFDNFKDSLDKDNNKSPFGEAGLLFDPIYRLTGGDKGGYAKFMRKTWEMPNKYVGQAVTKFDKFDRKINPIHKELDKTAFGGKAADYAHNKPGDSALAVLGSIFGGGAMLGGMGSGGLGSGAQSGWGGVFGNGGQAGMRGVGTGNVGQLFGSTGINTGGVAGVGATPSGAASTGFMGSMQNMNPQQMMQLGQQMGMQGTQQQEQPPPKPYVINGRVFWL